MTMRNDASRDRIATDDERRSRAVVARQGQVLLDTDVDQQARHQIERVEIETVDTLGSAGRLLVPAGNAGFEATPDGAPASFDIGSGHGYLDGWLLENPSPCKLTTQPHPRSGDAVKLPAVIALKALIRYVDPVEEPVLADAALGDAQASGRSLVDWQVFPLDLPTAGPVTCASVASTPTWQSLVAPSTGTLTVIEKATTPSTDPCSLTPGGGYSRLENLLYRFEVHGGVVDPAFPTVDGPRFGLHHLELKLSRRNASVMARIATIAGAEITVAPPALDPRNWFAPGRYAEIVSIHDDVDPRGASVAERLFQVALASDDRVVLEATATQIAATGATADGTWFLRQWAAFPRDAFHSGAGVAVVDAPGGAAESAEIDLGDGLKIKLGDSGSTATFRRGDYWTCAARADGSLDWPRTGGVPDAMRPHGPEVRYAPLAVVNPPSATPTVEDCRIPFATLSDRALLYRGGDGQSVFAPAASGMVALPAKLRVAVMRGETPVTGATVRWSFAAPSGSSCRVDGAVCDAANSHDTTTDGNGLAEVSWEIDGSHLLAAHELHAALVTGAATTQPVVFTAQFETAAHTGYTPGKCPDLAGVDNVQDALDLLCARGGGGCCVVVGKGGEFAKLDEALSTQLKKGERDICICLLPGEHSLAQDLDVEVSDLRLMVHGAGRASRLNIRQSQFWFRELSALILRDFDVIDPDGKNVVIEECDEVKVSNMRISGLWFPRDPHRSVLHIGAARLIELTSSSVAAYTLAAVEHARDILDPLSALTDFALLAFDLDGGVFAAVDQKLVDDIANSDLNKLISQIKNLNNKSREEELAFTALIGELGRAGGVKTSRLGRTLELLRSSLLLSEAGLAVAAGDARATTLVADSRIDGRLSVCGESNYGSRILSTDELALLTKSLRLGDANLVAGPGDLRLRNNRLCGVRVGREVMDNVRKVIIDGKGGIEGVPASLIADANVLRDTENSELMAIDLSLTQNVLHAMGLVGVVVAEQSRVIGNFGRGETTLLRVTERANLDDITGNGGLNIVSL